MNDITKPILSICMPTYNRAEHILESLTSIVSNITYENIGLVEIVVRDNCSTDSTENVLNEFIINNPLVNIRYVKSEQNFGYDKNIIELYKEAKGRYIWFIGDRYVLCVELSRIIRALVKYQPSFMGFSDLFTERKARIDNFLNLNQSQVATKKDYDLQVTLCDVPSLFIMEVAPLFASLPAVIFEANINDEILKKIWDKFGESQFMHIPLAIESIKATKNRTACIVNVYEKTFSSLSVANTLRFDPVLTTKGMRDIYEEYPLVGNFSERDAVNFFLYNGLISYKLGRQYIGIENINQLSKSLKQLNVKMNFKQKILIAIWGVPFVWPYRVAFLLFLMLRNDLRAGGDNKDQKAGNSISEMREFDRQVCIFKAAANK